LKRKGEWNMTQTVRVKKLRENAVLPSYGSDYAAGADLYACNAVTVEPGATEFVQTGLALEVPAGYAGLVYARSGLACKKGLAPANKVGVIDADYRGEIMVALYNHSSQAVEIEPGERVAQLVITPYLTAVFEETEELSDTVRGEGGFGSTGRK
jgi:dUTP pyrophosphatase